MRKLWRIIKDDAEFNIDCVGKKLIATYLKSIKHHFHCFIKGQKQSYMPI